MDIVLKRLKDVLKADVLMMWHHIFLGWFTTIQCKEL